MNTPAHALINLLLFRKRLREAHTLAIAAGAIVPDVPMMVFYVWAKVHHLSERVIWREAYFESSWQLAFDIFHSFPIWGLAALLAWRQRARVWMVFCMSVCLHSVFDLPVHHDDAHRHFIPLSSWRFISPVSYWNPAYYGQFISLIELVVVLVGSGYLFRSSPNRSLKIIVLIILALYLSHWAFVLFFWLG